MKQALILILFLSGSAFVFALGFSASANALGGLSLLSDSVADANISPVSLATGLNSYYYRPFNTPGIAIYGINSAISRKYLHIALGNSYLYHKDYTRHNPYLNINVQHSGLCLGGTGHLLYDSIQDRDGEYEYCYDLGMAYRLDRYAAELKALRIGSEDKQYSISLRHSLTQDVNAALAYVMQDEFADYLLAGIKTDISDHISLTASWQNKPSRFGSGLTVGLDRLSISYSIRTHPELNYSHAFGLELAW